MTLPITRYKMLGVEKCYAYYSIIILFIRFAFENCFLICMLQMITGHSFKYFFYALEISGERRLIT